MVSPVHIEQGIIQYWDACLQGRFPGVAPHAPFQNRLWLPRTEDTWPLEISKKYMYDLYVNAGGSVPMNEFFAVLRPRLYLTKVEYQTGRRKVKASAIIGGRTVEYDDSHNFLRLMTFQAHDIAHRIVSQRPVSQSEHIALMNEIRVWENEAEERRKKFRANRKYASYIDREARG